MRSGLKHQRRVGWIWPKASLVATFGDLPTFRPSASVQRKGPSILKKKARDKLLKHTPPQITVGCGDIIGKYVRRRLF